eukprot:CAMPEP_0171125978 /NCGR_PEP_ID=MMETSP0766_2-20121228/112385_1 /TAXON_ID=439317 /ORGANISM="Gambierdiscus australes, Strain CAWD 149" /LENGTH=314 /DNA_ID=CAMNT_0011588979 /DNA_START=42 /DNA_END=986 /DNA_ORIENTATION=+
MGERPGDWQCPNASCQNHTRMVFGSKANCPKCGAGRDDPPTAEMPTQYMPQPEKGVQAQGFAVKTGIWDTGAARALSGMGLGTASQGADMADDWQCPNSGCINHTKLVFGKRSSCPSCGTARNAKQPGDWQCPNVQCLNHRNTVFASKMTCPKCGQPRPGAFVATGSQQVQVNNPLAGLQLPFGNLLNMTMRTDMADGNGMSVGGGSPGDWRCPNVSCINNRKMVFAKNSMCPKCGSLKETAAPMPQPGHVHTDGTACVGHGHGGGNPGDWVCPNTDCLNHRNKVFAKHSQCPNCGMEKPEELRARSRSPYRMS